MGLGCPPSIAVTGDRSAGAEMGRGEGAEMAKRAQRRRQAEVLIFRIRMDVDLHRKYIKKKRGGKNGREVVLDTKSALYILVHHPCKLSHCSCNEVRV